MHFIKPIMMSDFSSVAKSAADEQIKTIATALSKSGCVVLSVVHFIRRAMMIDLTINDVIAAVKDAIEKGALTPSMRVQNYENLAKCLGVSLKFTKGSELPNGAFGLVFVPNHCFLGYNDNGVYKLDDTGYQHDVIIDEEGFAANVAGKRSVTPSGDSRRIVSCWTITR
jgi:hypothetical protein